ncbi:hypothetical protein IPN35_03430 [Candidatus Peregrinibacteria bacterium]|nr:MAG: hypothetical protein IPN35_03430 [Candidatus Peregrinibacteria bacterium]
MGIAKDEFNEKSIQIRRRQEEIIDKKKLHNDADEKFGITVTYLSLLQELTMFSKVPNQRRNESL